MDRIDIHIGVPQLQYAEMASVKESEGSSSIALRVEAARRRQSLRLAETGIFCNAQMNHRQLREFCRIRNDAQNLLRNAFEKMKLNARSYDRIIKVAQTIADLAGATDINASHMSEAIQLRISVPEMGNERM